jgi:hypothetical protein
MSKLILVEGIPGSGKSTTARKIEALLKARGIPTRCFQEGDLHPCDLAWHACVPTAVYKELLRTFDQEKSVLEQYTSAEEDYAYVAYTKLGLRPDHPLFIKLASYEPYNGKVTLNDFKRLHFARWQKFGERTHDQATYIFECAYLQNHVAELTLIYQLSRKDIINYMQELIETVRSLEPFLLYLSPADVTWTITNAAQERQVNGWRWIDGVIDYIANSNYGKANKMTGLADCIEFFKQRQRLEREIIKELSIGTYVYELAKGFTQPALEDNTELVHQLLKG